MSKELPAHIANLLQRQQRSPDGRPADSAGVPWEGRDLAGEGNPLHTFDGDDGLATPQVLTAAQALISGTGDEAGFVNALAGQRLFAPVIATVAEEGEALEAGGPVGDKQADIALVTLTAPDGRQAMPVFTSVQALTDWHSEARPVAAEAERIMLAALAEGAELVVLDPGAELTFVIRRPALEALAQGSTWVPSYADAELAQALSEVPDLCPGVESLVLQPNAGIVTTTASGTQVIGGGAGPELSIGVICSPGADAVDERLALAAVQAALEDVEILRRRADSLQILSARRQ